MLVSDLKRIFHKHDMYITRSLTFDSENTNYFGQQTLRVVLVMVCETWMEFKEKQKFFISHRFNNEFLVVAKKEETPTFARAFACFKYLFKIELWT